MSGDCDDARVLPLIPPTSFVVHDPHRRAVVPGLPHRLSEPRHGGSAVFFDEGDYALYRDGLGEPAAASASGVLSYVELPIPMKAAVRWAKSVRSCGGRSRSGRA